MIKITSKNHSLSMSVMASTRIDNSNLIMMIKKYLFQKRTKKMKDSNSSSTDIQIWWRRNKVILQSLLEKRRSLWRNKGVQIREWRARFENPSQVLSEGGLGFQTALPPFYHLKTGPPSFSKRNCNTCHKKIRRCFPWNAFCNHWSLPSH